MDNVIAFPGKKLPHPANDDVPEIAQQLVNAIVPIPSRIWTAPGCFDTTGKVATLIEIAGEVQLIFIPRPRGWTVD